MSEYVYKIVIELSDTNSGSVLSEQTICIKADSFKNAVSKADKIIAEKDKGFNHATHKIIELKREHYITEV